MDRIAELTDEECSIFRNNLAFMWQRLSTNHYHVKHDTPSARALHIVGAEVLPAYSTLSRCVNDKDYVPPQSVVDKIVIFYNLNITPETDTYQFLHERLDLTPELRSRKSNVIDERFLGTYYLYYPSAADSDLLHGGILKIYKTPGMLRAAVITGLRNDAALVSKDALAVFDEKPNLKKYTAYYNLQDKNNRRCSYYEGNVEITQRSLLIHFYEPNGALKKLTFTLNIHQFTSLSKPYDGGMGYILCTSDGSFDTRFFKAGIMSILDGCLSLEDERVKDALNFKEIDNRKVTLASSIDRAWFDLILASLRDGTGILPPSPPNKTDI